MERIRRSFDRQGFMRTVGAALESVEPGTVTITCAFENGLTQQHGLLHGGLLATLLDVACGYAALSVMPADREVLTVEFKINFLKPAKADTLAATGQVLRAGKTIIASESEVYAMGADGPVLVAKCMSTLAVIPQRERFRPGEA